MVFSKKMSSQLMILSIIFFSSIILLASELFWFNKNMSEVLIHFFYLKGLFKTLVYSVAYLSCLLFLSSIIFIRNSYCFSILFVLSIISYFVTTSYLLINGYGFGMTEMQVFALEFGKLSNDTWGAYGSYILTSIAIVAPVAILVIIARIIINKKNLYIKKRYITVLGLASAVMTLAITFKTTNTSNEFPTPYNFYITISYYFLNSTYYDEREPLQKTPSANAQYKNIIWIVDESISEKYLSINGYNRPSTPYLESIKDQYVNLGRASSLANCSAMTNIGLMSGIQIDQMPDTENLALKKPSIFQYAKNAGFKTHYISGQSHDDLLQNYMTKFDLRSIDHFYQPSADFVDDSIPEEDIINETHKALKNNEKNFIFIVKRGAHFHWAGQTPEEKITFRPNLKMEDGLIIENKEKAINSYLNTVKYRVDDFFKTLFSQTDLLDDDDTIIIYTSDHGQSILEKGISKGTHCDSTDPNIEQGTVPLLIFTKKEKEKFSKLTKNTFSHFEIFPTTLGLMGYPNDTSGYTFFNKPDAKQVFISGDIFGRASFHLNDISKQPEAHK